MAFTKVATKDEIPNGMGKQVVVAGRNVALFNVEGTYYAIDDTCPHRGAPLSEGTLEGAELTCPWHGARFDVTSGSVLCPPARSGVRVHKVQVVGEEIQIEVS